MARSRHTPLNTVKVVITGQDPYHGPNQAHGLSFSVRPPTPAPPSLQNIYKALKKDYPDYQPPPKKGGLLTPWADRGVLLLNTCLTVRRGEANSHQGKGWELLTQKVIDTVVRVRSNGVVFMAWGSPAQKRTVGIPVDKHLILKSVHPSPLSAMRGFVSCLAVTSYGGFDNFSIPEGPKALRTVYTNAMQFDCHHFTKANEWLVQRYGKDGGIDWDLNVSHQDIVEPGKTGRLTDIKDKTGSGANEGTKENEIPSQNTKIEKDEVIEEKVVEKAADPEAEIDSDEEAALREAGL